MSEDRWFSTGFGASDARNIDREKGVIYGAKVIQIGEAKGHGMFVDGDFIDSVVEFGNATKQGIKARFGHPNMCNTALGTFLGRWKGFYRDGDEIRANLFLSNTSKDTPNGDLHSYVMDLAEAEAESFGVSIAFSRDLAAEEEAGLHEDLQIARLKSLKAADCVDEPAATSGGLFSEFSKNSIAGQLTEFLDLNPEIWDAFESNPDILKSLSEHGDKMDEFMDRYREYREHNGGHSMSDKPEGADALEEPEVPETPETPETPENLETEDAPDAPEGEDAPEGDDAPEVPEEGSDEPEDAPEAPEEGADEPESELSREDFLRIDEEFGSDIAAKTVRDGGDYVSALRTSHDALKDENKVLREKIAAFETKTDGGTPAVVTEATKKAALFNTGK